MYDQSFPIPVLDGGQLVMLGAEAIKGRVLSEQAIENFKSWICYGNGLVYLVPTMI